MYCVKCGTKAEKGQKICHECGMRLVSPETLLKLLKKADLEKKQRRMENNSFLSSEKDEKFVKSFVEKIKEDEPKPKKKKDKEAAIKPDEKPALSKKPHEGKRVAPILENPTQPKRKSIFDDFDDSEKVLKKKPAKDIQKPAGKKNVNPVVRLPERKTSVPSSVKRNPKATRSDGQLSFIREQEDFIRLPAAPVKTQRPNRTNPQSAVNRRPDRTKSEPVKTISPPKKARPAPKKASLSGSGAKKTRSKREEESFVEKYLRSIISMMLLTCTVIMMLMWGYATDSGLRTMAELGLGSRKGYILLGDDCMNNGNYKRAVEHYYKALSKKVNYEAGIKLARAYRQTGEAEKETSALLLLMDRYEGMDEPYQRILELFPDPNGRPEIVQNAINMHER